MRFDPDTRPRRVPADISQDLALVFGPNASGLTPDDVEVMTDALDGIGLFDQVPLDGPLTDSPRDTGTVMAVVGRDGERLPAFEVSDQGVRFPELRGETLGDLLRGTDLQYALDAYPQLEGVDFGVSPWPGSAGTYFVPGRGSSSDPFDQVSDRVSVQISPLAYDEDPSVLLHELQHVIDHIEGRDIDSAWRYRSEADRAGRAIFDGAPLGQRTRAFYDGWPLLQDAMEQYTRTPAEFTSFGVQARRDMNPDELAATPFRALLPGDRRVSSDPLMPGDVMTSDQIIERFLGRAIAAPESSPRPQRAPSSPRSILDFILGRDPRRGAD